MWMMKRKGPEELDGILYFLSNALTSVLDDNSHLAHHGAMVPKIGAGLGAAEIASRLAMFREQVCDVSQREFMVVTKLARARHWARELRRFEPHLRADIDAFLSVTARCETMARDCAPDPESLFDGQAQPKRFLAGRVPGGRSAAEAALSLMERLQAAERGEALPDDGGPRYLIGGELSVEALDEACERLLARLSEHYGWDDHAADAIDEDETESLENEPEASLPDTTTEAETAEAAATGQSEPEAASENDAPPPETITEAATCQAPEAEDPFARAEDEPVSAQERSGKPEATQAT